MRRRRRTAAGPVGSKHASRRRPRSVAKPSAAAEPTAPVRTRRLSRGRGAYRASGTPRQSNNASCLPTLPRPSHGGVRQQASVPDRGRHRRRRKRHPQRGRVGIEHASRRRPRSAAPTATEPTAPVRTRRLSRRRGHTAPAGSRACQTTPLACRLSGRSRRCIGHWTADPTTVSNIEVKQTNSKFATTTFLWPQ